MPKIFFVTGIVLMLLGKMIRKLKVVELMGMYNARTCTDKDGLAKWMGRSFMLVGLLSISLSFVPLPETGNLRLWVYLLLIIGVLTLTAIGTRKFS